MGKEPILIPIEVNDLHPDRQPRLAHLHLQFTDFDLSEVKDGCGQYSIGFAQGDGLDAVLDGTSSATCDQG